MSKKELPVQQEPTGELFVSNLEDVLHNSMLPYAEYVILDRALPRVEDGLKPVQRRILYTMNEMGLTPDKPHKKCARIVGECMGKYHPHGDSSVYDALVRLAQDFNMGQILVDGHGNFGSVDGDSAAAMRYTEARMAPMALEMLRDLEKETVPWQPNFDDSLKEPTLLPSRIPNLLVNGAYGIAVGLATNIPPHNLGEVADGVIAYIDNPRIKLEELEKIVPAPDFPTGGYIIANDLKEAYRSGKGKISIRAKMHVEPDGEKKLLVVTEIPYQVNKAQLLRKIADLRSEKNDSKRDEIMDSVLDVSDESDRTGMRAVIKVKPDTDVNKLWKYLCKNTDMEVSFGINMVAIADGKPQQLGLLEIIRHYVNFQREVILRRSRYDLAQAKERCHILEGLIVAVRNIDEVIAIIKKAESTADAKQKLRERFDLSERQAQAILDLRLARLTKLEVFKLEQELEELRKRIEELTEIVGSQRKQLEVVKTELKATAKKFARPRRSELVQKEEDIVIPRMDIKAPGVNGRLLVMQDGNVKFLTEKSFNSSFKGVSDRTSENTLIKLCMNVLSDKTVLAFTDKGNAYKIQPEEALSKYSDKGMTLSELNSEAGADERIVAVFEDGAEEDEYLFITAQGMLKRTLVSDYKLNKKAYQAIRLAEGDKVLTVEIFTVDVGETVFFVTKEGNCLSALMDDIPIQGRISGGVRGIKLASTDEVVFATQTNNEGEVIVCCKDGKCKRVVACSIEPMARYRKGYHIVPLGKGDEVLFADYVDIPYYLAIKGENGAFTSYYTEDLVTEDAGAKGKKLKGVEGYTKIYALKYWQ